jgi:holo-[acyl-carrier protein] synthase
VSTRPSLIDAAIRALGADADESSSSLAVGVDIVDLREFHRLLVSALGPPFLDRSFGRAERDYCGENLQRLGGRWAAKEAVAKAIGTGFRLGLNPRDIRVLHDPGGAPLLSARDGATWPNGAQSWDWSISIAHEDDIAIAVAIARMGGRHGGL